MASVHILALGFSGEGATAPPTKPNVLYLMADDMRPQLGAYGHTDMSTPHLDALASGGLLFDQAYTQFAYCAPSRNSFMSGRRPERTLALNFQSDFRDHHGDAWVTMPQHFKNNGYFTSAAGKLYHDGMDDPASWSYPSNQTEWIHCQEGDYIEPNGNYCGITNASKIQYTDEDLALAEGFKRLELAHASGKPWWVGIGVHRPHHSSRVPQGWYGTEVYPGEIEPPKHPLAPEGAPYMSGNWFRGDYKDQAHGCPTCSVPPVRAVEYRRWYYAATSYADHMLGQALSKLEDLGADVAARTITVFHADHGYQLGELNEWSKKTDTELATRVPMMIRVPWKARTAAGKRTAVNAELVDMFKTLAELSGLSGGVQPDVQGTSLAPLFDDPSGAAAAGEGGEVLQARAAYSQIGSCDCVERTVLGWTGVECNAGRCLKTPVPEFDFMGYTMRTADGWRFTAWVPMNANTSRVDWGRKVWHELYDLRGLAAAGNDFDFDGLSVNVAGQHTDLVAQLHGELKAAVDSWY